MIRDEPMIVDVRLPYADKAMRKFSALEEFLEPNTAWKNKEAASWVDCLSWALGTKICQVSETD